ASACIAVLADPRAAADSSIAKATGVSGGAATTALTWFPIAAAAAGVLLALCGVLALVASRRWPTRTKYDAASRASGRGGAGSAGSGADSESAAPVDQIDGWDQLTRGDDPTR
ncbi:Trp biosynthesis-associated membrane protein, partial [Sinomonas sp. G460-2]|uniref:Trp biosynthesis-associated membrane protein n=1 Tax=Sinomonas sp. G460-2 TaxID=3393464 RepID=UPI0039F07AB8